MADEKDLLLTYLSGRDVECPRCGYNLRNLEKPVCPECREELSLAVGFDKPHFLWLVATVTPGFFSGICAAMLMIPIVGATLIGFPQPWPFYAAEAFGLTSVLAAFLLLRFRYAFLGQAPARQRQWAVVAWAMHVGAFVLFVAALIIYA